MSQEEDYRRALQNAVSAMMMKPDLFVLAMIVKAARVVIREDIPTEGTDGKTIFLSPRFLTLTPQEQVYVLTHEAMHIVRLDPVRMENYKKMNIRISPATIGMLYNIIADAKVNTGLSELGIQVPPDRPMCNRLERFGIKLGYNDCVQKSVEEILDGVLAGNQPVQAISGAQDDLMMPESEGDSTRKGGREKVIVLNEGDDDLVNSSSEELKKKVIIKLMTAAFLKNAGTLPGWAARIVDELFEPRIDWRRLLMGYLHTGSKVRMVLTRPNRKIEDLPGKKLYGSADVVVLVDTSGSISESELRQFVSEVRGMTPASKKIVVIPFDATAYPEVIIKGKSDIAKLVLNLKGGGGTTIGPALEVVVKKYLKADKIVILSDWDIDDLDDPVVNKTLRKLADKIIAVTTHSEPPSYIKKKIHIKI